MGDLISKKEKILEFITEYIQKHGYSPSYNEIGEAVGLKSKSSINRYIHKMIETGMLETDAEWASARALRVPGYKLVKEIICTTPALHKDDPVYYKVVINKLIKQAKDNDLKIDFELISVDNTVNQIKVMFENDIGEIAGAVVYKREL